MLLAKIALAAVSLVAVIFSPLSDLYPMARGMSPLHHLAVPYGFEESDLPDLSGKHFLVTGANSGVGWGTTKVLVRNGATVYMACRSLQSCELAKSRILQELNDVADTHQLVCEQLDLVSLGAVKQYSDEFVKSGRRLDSLILNAGILYPPFALTEDALESTWAVNHVAHSLLALELLPVLRKSPKATIVFVSSNGHHTNVYSSENNIGRFNDPATYNVVTQYARSKLANILFAKELAKKVGPSILVNSLNPGGVQANIYRHLSPIPRFFMERMVSVFFWTEEQSALTVIGCAWNPKVFEQHITGKYFVPVWREDPGSADVRNDTLSKLWFDETRALLKAKGFLKADHF